MNGRIFWYYDTLTPRSASFVVAVGGAIGEVMERLAAQVEQYAQANAPWEDRSGDARRGLQAESVKGELLTWAIVLYHSVDYGVWLETIQSGRYAIIIPTLESQGPVVMAELNTVFDIA